MKKAFFFFTGTIFLVVLSWNYYIHSIQKNINYQTPTTVSLNTSSTLTARTPSPLLTTPLPPHFVTSTTRQFLNPHADFTFQYPNNWTYTENKNPAGTYSWVFYFQNIPLLFIEAPSQSTLQNYCSLPGAPYGTPEKIQTHLTNDKATTVVEENCFAQTFIYWIPGLQLHSSVDLPALDKRDNFHLITAPIAMSIEAPNPKEEEKFSNIIHNIAESIRIINNTDITPSSSPTAKQLSTQQIHALSQFLFIEALVDKGKTPETEIMDNFPQQLSKHLHTQAAPEWHNYTLFNDNPDHHFSLSMQIPFSAAWTIENMFFSSTDTLCDEETGDCSLYFGKYIVSGNDYTREYILRYGPKRSLSEIISSTRQEQAEHVDKKYIEQISPRLISAGKNKAVSYFSVQGQSAHGYSGYREIALPLKNITLYLSQSPTNPDDLEPSSKELLHIASSIRENNEK